MPASGAATGAETISASEARRVLLSVQGLLDDPRRRATTSAVHKVICQMGFVQIDSINTIERAHHLILFSRLHGYRHQSLTKLLEESRELFEHWTHDASAIPTKWFPHWRHRFERDRHKSRAHKWWQQRMGPRPQETIDHVLERIRREGPILARDFEHRGHEKWRPEKGWWAWKPQKAALEHLWRTGELAVVKRINFQKVYDISERVLPEAHRLSVPSFEEHVDWACREALERLGLATPREIAAFWQAIDLVQARQWCAHAQQRGEIIAVNVESADGSNPRLSFALSDYHERVSNLPHPRDVNREIRLLAPFDPVLRDRQRTKRLFNFDFTLEAFVPASKRRYGYYVLPIMEGDAFIGRLDPKFHREKGLLEIRGLWLEPRIKATKARSLAIRNAIENLAGFVGASSLQVPRQLR